MPIPQDVLANANTLGEAVRRLREAKNLTLRELASKIGVSAPFLSDLEHDRRKTDKTADLARELGVGEEELKRFDPRVSPDLKKWMDANPSVVAVLDSFRRSGQDLQVLLRAFRTADKKQARRG